MTTPPDPHQQVRAHFEQDAATYPAGEPRQPVQAVDYRRTRDALMRSYTGLDITAGMLEHARAVVDAPNATFVHADFLEWRHDGPPFDAVFSVRVLEYFRDKRLMAERLAALVRPGGRLVLVTKTPGSPFRASGYLTWAWRNRVRRMPKRSTGGTNGGTSGGGGGPDAVLWWELISPGALARLLREAGFTDIGWGPVVLRPPVFKDVAGDLPIVPVRRDGRLTRALEGLPLGLAARPLTRLSESYVLVARRAGGTG